MPGKNLPRPAVVNTAEAAAYLGIAASTLAPLTSTA